MYIILIIFSPTIAGEKLGDEKNGGGEEGHVDFCTGNTWESAMTVIFFPLKQK